MDFKTAFFAVFVCWPIAIGAIIAITIHLIRRIRRLENVAWEDRLICSRNIPSPHDLYPSEFTKIISREDLAVEEPPRKVRYDPPWKPHQLVALGLHLRRTTRGGSRERCDEGEEAASLPGRTHGGIGGKTDGLLSRAAPVEGNYGEAWRLIDRICWWLKRFALLPIGMHERVSAEEARRMAGKLMKAAACYDDGVCPFCQETANDRD